MARDWTMAGEDHAVGTPPFSLVNFAGLWPQVSANLATVTESSLFHGKQRQPFELPSLSTLACVTMATVSLSVTKSESSWADCWLLLRTVDSTGGRVWLEFGWMCLGGRGTVDRTGVGDGVKVLVWLVPWFPFKLDSSIGFSMAGWLRGGAKTTQTSRDSQSKRHFKNCNQFQS